MTLDASFKVRRILVSNDRGDTQLLVQLDIDCGSCGQTQGIIHGHHVRTLHYALGKILELHPALCGEVGALVEETSFHGVVDPEKARLN